MVWFKCCPRCTTGDLSEERDQYGKYVICLQCGYYLTDGERVLVGYTSPIKTVVQAHKGTASLTAAIGEVR